MLLAAMRFDSTTNVSAGGLHPSWGGGVGWGGRAVRSSDRLKRKAAAAFLLETDSLFGCGAFLAEMVPGSQAEPGALEPNENKGFCRERLEEGVQIHNPTHTSHTSCGLEGKMPPCFRGMVPTESFIWGCSGYISAVPASPLLACVHASLSWPWLCSTVAVRGGGWGVHINKLQAPL